MKAKLISVLLLIVSYQFKIVSCKAQQCCDVPGWQYVVQVDIDNTYSGNTAHANYQVLLQVNTQTPISQNKMNASGSDIRFTTVNCGPFLDYYIESGINTTTTNIWVKVPNLPANSVTSLFMYYGNSAAVSMSNFNLLFPSNYILNIATSLSGVQTYDWIEIQAGGTINLGSGLPLTLNARRIIIAGTINGNNLGYGPGAGPGAGQNGGGSRGGGGGGYGGNGGSGGCSGGNSGVAYGTPNGLDIDMGSGGGNSDCNANVRGGGVVTLQATEVDISGTISMNGGSMSGNCNEEAAGAGAGGGILISADYINGSGSMNARGGIGQNSSNKEGGGGGGGGRIKLFYCKANNYNGITNVSKGTPGNGSQCSANDGGDGSFSVNTKSCINVIFGAEAPIRIMPVAAFNATNVCLDSSTNFTDASTIAAGATITNWAWDFGDASTQVTTQNSVHTYSVANTFQVTLSITSNEGCVATVIQPVVVYPAPTADFTFISQCDGSAIPFTDVSVVSLPQNIVSWSWDFNNDLNSDDISQNPTFTFASQGNYNVGLGVVTDMGCIGSVTHLVTVFSNPIADFSASVVCEGLATSFTDVSTGTPVSWSWDFGDGSPLNNTQNPNHTYSTYGTYSVILIISDANGCQNTIAKSILVYPNPIADFTSIPACETLPASFTDISTVSNPYSVTGWTWDFGDGSPVSSTQNPNHIYNVANSYNVTLVVTSDMGCINTSTNSITVFLAPTVDFSFTDDCENIPISFTDISTITSPSTITNWNWDFGDGSALSTNAIEQHSYSSDGTFNVNITVTTSDGCMASAAHPVTVFPEPVAAFTVAQVCDGNSSSFVDASNISSGNITNYDWDFGGGNTSTIQNPQFTFITIPGTSAYSTTLTVTSSDGCISSVSNNAIVNPNPTADFIMNPISGCAGDLISFIDNSTAPLGGTISVYDYDFNDNVPSVHSDTANSSFNYTLANIYNPTLTITSDQGCTDSTSVSITINPIPAADFTSDMVCLGNSTSFIDASVVASGTLNNWSWDFGDGSPTISQSNPTHSFATDGTHSVSLTVTSDASCTSLVTEDVIVYPVPVPSFTSIAVCEGSPTIFTGTSTINSPGLVASSDWDLGDGSAHLYTTDLIYTYSSPNDYQVTLTVTSDAGCTAAITQTDTVYPNPLASFTLQVGNQCTPAEVRFNDASTITNPNANQNILQEYSWQMGDGAEDNSPNPVHIYSIDGSYSVTLTVSTNHGCTNTYSMADAVEVYPNPVAGFSPNFTEVDLLNPNITFNNLSSGATVWHYEFGDNYNSDEANPTHTYSDSGCYEVLQTVYNNEGCGDSTTQTVCVTAIYTLYVPNSFTINNDFVNETFNATGEGIRDYEIKIYNRWGQEVFRSKSLENDWDGIDALTGMDAKQGTYIYRINIIDFKDRPHYRWGFVNLFR